MSRRPGGLRLPARRLVGNGVHAARAQGIATGDAAEHEPAAANEAVAFNGFEGIRGARGMEAALVAQPWAEQQAIHLYKKNQDAAHFLPSCCQWRSRLRRSTSLGALAASRFAITTMSMAGSCFTARRKDSRARRLIRLRSTAAVETLRETARPMRASASSPDAASRVKNLSEERTPVRKTRVNSSGFSSRLWRGKPSPRLSVTDRGAPGPWHGVRSVPCGRPWWPCARGSHGSAYDEGCWAGRFFS